MLQTNQRNKGNHCSIADPPVTKLAALGDPPLWEPTKGRYARFANSAAF